jgi:hypothetical protein
MLQAYSVSNAKSHLAKLRRNAITNWQESIIENGKENQSQSVSLIATVVIDDLTSYCKFTHEWVKEDEDISWTLICPEIDIFGVGESKEEAIESLIDTALEYTELFFESPAIYMSNASGDRRKHYGFLRRIARCNDDRYKIREVLGLY